MKVRHANKVLERMEAEPGFTGGYGQDVVKAFRKRMQIIRAAKDERDFYAMAGSLRYEKLKGKRQHQRSMRLNSQFRLIVELEKEQDGNLVVIIKIEDYH